MMAPQPGRRIRARVLTWVEVILCLILVSCSIPPNLPTVQDNRIDEMVRSEAARIMTVSEDWDNFSKYQFLLADFPRKDILGMSVGNRRIYISYRLASLALTDSSHRWLLRQTVAHEIAHETAGHAKREGDTWFNRAPFTWAASGRQVGLPWYVRLYNYSSEKELEADRIGLVYWKKLGWDCRIWVEILENFQNQGYSGDIFHPTDRRLQQAKNVCELRRQEKPPVPNALPAENPSSRSVN